MPYEPNAKTGSDRDFTMHMMWVGFAASLLLFFGVVFGFADEIDRPAGGFTAGSLLGLAFVREQDEYFKQLIAFAARWACVIIGLWILASIFSYTEVIAGEYMIWLTLTAATFHVAFAVARLRG